MTIPPVVCVVVSFVQSRLSGGVGLTLFKATGRSPGSHRFTATAGTKFPVALLGALARTRTVTNPTFPVATTSSAMLSDLSLVTRLEWVSFEISIKCVGASHSYSLMHSFSLWAPVCTQSHLITGSGST